MQIKINDLTLKEKIAQMVMVRGHKFDKRFTDLGIGGIFFPKGLKKKDYNRLVGEFNQNSKIKLFMAVDLEGYDNPFSEFFETVPFWEVNSSEDVYDLGKDHGRILKEIGMNLNFSPVVEIKNNVWPGRSFRGTIEEIKAKIENYIIGLQENKMISTAKHYPGGSMVKDPHKISYETEIIAEDIGLFDCAIHSGVKAIMIGHPIVYGVVNSNGKPCTVSKEIIGELRNKFDGLIITDGISMEGLKSLYSNLKNLYSDLVKAGNDIILDSHPDSSYEKVIERIKEVEKSVLDGEIIEHRINESVKRILRYKGYEII